MRYLFIGYSALALETIKTLLRRNHDVILLDKEQQRVETLQGDLDCRLFLGDGSNTEVLEELYDPQIETVFCLSDEEAFNILSSLNAQLQGFKHVITGLQDEASESLCLELGLHNLFLPLRTLGCHLAEFAEGGNSLDLQSLIKYDARLFSFIAQAEDEKPVFDISLPSKSRIICVYRDSVYLWPDASMALQMGDEVVMITHIRHLDTLRQRWGSNKREHQKIPTS